MPVNYPTLEGGARRRKPGCSPSVDH